MDRCLLLILYLFGTNYEVNYSLGHLANYKLQIANCRNATAIAILTDSTVAIDIAVVAVGVAAVGVGVADATETAEIATGSAIASRTRFN